MGDLSKDVKALQGKMLDLEARSRRNNLILAGLPEGKEAGGISPLLDKILRHFLKLSDTIPAPEIERAHRALRPIPDPGHPPRHIIIRFLRWSDKNEVFKTLASAKGKLTWDGHDLRMFQDFPMEIQRQRDSYRELRSILRKENLRHGILYPARLIVTINEETFIFKEPKEAEKPQVGDWVNNNQVALHTGEQVKQSLSDRDDEDGVIGEVVGVTCSRGTGALLPRLLVAQPQVGDGVDNSQVALHTVMAANSSSNSTLHPADCLNPILVFTALYVVYILLVPLFIFVLYIGFQRWRKRGSATTTSHTDVFTFHMVILELIGVVGDTIYCYGIYSNQKCLTKGMNVFSVISPGQALFHLLTCVERYLAVVHPVIYLRQRGGVRIRNISIGFLFVLIRPGPGEGGGNRERVDQSKQRAFYNIMAIMAALFLRLLSDLVSTSLYISSVLDDCEEKSSILIVMAAHSSSNSTLHPADCLNPIYIFTALYVVYILLIPLFIFVLYIGFQRWRKRGSAATMSHTDVFTFHMVTLELIGVVGYTIYCYGIYSNQKCLTKVGTYVFSVNLPGQTLFHLLTCVERYLAVVHPVIYLRLRQGGGVRIRNISIGLEDICIAMIIITFVYLVFSLIVAGFCSISVLFVLIRPGPGEGGGQRERVDQSKQRAFYTIMAIMAALLLRFLSNLVSSLLYISSVLDDCDVILTMWSAYCFDVPSNMAVNSSSNSSVPPADCLNPIFVFTPFTSSTSSSFQRWRKRGSAATTSHTDVFTFHMVILELIGVLGFTFYCYGIYTDGPFIIEVGSGIFAVVSPGQTLFHLLTCVERYLAVVHPVIYLRLRQGGGVRIRNISIGVSVLFVLIRPGPGEGGGNRERVDQSKQRAFYAIMAIMAVLLLRFLSSIVTTSLYVLMSGTCQEYCYLCCSYRERGNYQAANTEASSKQMDMSANSSANSSANCSTNSSVHLPDCQDNAKTSVFTALYIVYILLVPLFIFVLYIGFQRWRKRGSATTTSHTDVFTFHMVILELIGVVGNAFYCHSLYTHDPVTGQVGKYVLSAISPGQTLFHMLTCVERYLAVVHPVIYLRLRQGGGVRIRNISIGCVWCICFFVASLQSIPMFQLVIALMFFAISLIVAFFCSISVLFVLIRPGPGEGGGKRERVDHSKQRALHTMMAITAALSWRLLSILLISSLYSSPLVAKCDIALMIWSAYWFTLPSSLVLPLLHISEAEKPNASNADVSDPDSAPLPQYQVGEGVNNSQVALHTGEQLKQSLSGVGDTQGIPNIRPHQVIEICANEGEGKPQPPPNLNNIALVIAMTVWKALCFDWSTRSLVPPPSPGPGCLRTWRTEMLQNETTIKSKSAKHPSEAQYPNTSNANVSDLDPTPLPQSQVGDGVNNSQVALHTGEQVKHSLSEIGDNNKCEPNKAHHQEMHEAANEEEGKPHP
ncbi:hypothetical protein F7725_005015 [Dissostichus mawsoni]|uniref:Uncharacterized protein n=1 Tax=Dissostichus mawsoni TaxID=36200 RepID=A0A7J5XKR9_DISMA|nr:hypothetical protein F7725_005015 [Dissostichus mawsoni]